jgi:hypothetical protein
MLVYHIREMHKQKTTFKTVRQKFVSLESPEKEIMIKKVSAMEELITATLSPKNPGFYKASGAWREWSKDDRLELGGFRKFGDSYYVKYAMANAEQAMRIEQNALEKAEDKGVPLSFEKTEKMAQNSKRAVELAALMWAIYWPEQVEKARQRKLRKLASQSQS